MINVFLGFDPRQPVAYNVLAHSIASRASKPVSITRLQLDQLPITRRGLTEFTYSRFLVPWLSNYEGVSIFLDSDMLCLCDIQSLLAFPMEYPGVPVFVVPHTLKFERPSVMVFRNALCKVLTPEYIQNVSNPLFNFGWTSAIGGLPAEYNHLVGYDQPSDKAKIIHFTQGIPCWPETKDSEYAADWHAEARNMVSTVSFDDLMGHSVHVKHVQKRLQEMKSANV
jgi:lipopolysaccharide biosynthesis glycosyltransferase